MSEKVFVAHVTLSWGEKRDYLIANDVEPEHIYKYLEITIIAKP